MNKVQVRIGIIFIVLMMIMSVGIYAQNQEVVNNGENYLEEDHQEVTDDVIIDEEEKNELIENLENYFQTWMGDENIPGLAYAIVYQGDVVTGGLGYANVERQIPIEPAETLFPLEDIAKSFTTAAVLQLAELEAVNLNDDISKYLDQSFFKNRYARPLSITNLLTHTSGFADNVSGYAINSDEISELEEYLRKNVPPQVAPPGKVSTYGDYAHGLAGLIIEQVTELSFSQYMQDYLLTPMDMHSSRFSLAEIDTSDMAQGYTEARGELVANLIPYPQNLPANGLVSTVEDMANFIKMNLSGGFVNGNQILNDQSLGLMHNVQYRQHPLLPGWTLGFYGREYQEQRVVIHGGDSEAGYSSILLILPDSEFGVIVSMNRYLPKFGTCLTNYILEQITPETKVESLIPVDGGQLRSQWLVGDYALDYPSWGRLAGLRKLLTQIYVKVDENGIYHIDFPREMDLPNQWVEVEPLLLRSVDSHDYLIFADDSYGNITHLYAGGLYNFTKIPWYKSAEISVIALCIFVIFFVSMCLIWLVRKIRSRALRAMHVDRFHQNMGTLISVINLVFLVGIWYYISNYAQQLIYGISPVLFALLILPFASIVLTAILILGGSSINKRRWSFSLKFYHLIVSIVLVVFLIYIWIWGLISI